MGCGYVTQKESIKTKDVILDCKISKEYYYETKDPVNLNKTQEDIYLSKKSTSNNVRQFKEDKKIKKKKEQSNIYNKKEPVIYGPIITMLKKQYDNINKKKKIN